MNTEIIKKVAPSVTGIIPSLLPLSNKNKGLSSWIYSKIALPLNIGGHEYDADFIHKQLDSDSQKELMNIFINWLKEKEVSWASEMLEKIQTENHEGYDAEKVLLALSYSLKNHFSETQKVLAIFELIHSKNSQDELEKYINTPFYKTFCDGLGLNYDCRVLFFLCLANSFLQWIFPNSENNDYNSRIFCSILEKDIESETDFSRKINNKLIEKGLFAGAWKIQPYALAAFTGGIPSFEFSKSNYPIYSDIYDYQKVFEENKEKAQISFALLKSFNKDRKNCIQLISAEEDSRAMLFLYHNLSKIGKKLYEITSNVSAFTKQELEFYIYLYSLTLNEENSVIYLSEAMSSIFCEKKEAKKNIISLSNSEEEIQLKTPSLLSYIKVPVFLYSKAISKDAIKSCIENGIEIWNSFRVYFSDASITEANPKEFFSHIGKTNFIKSLCSLVLERKINPDQWNKLLELGQNSAYLSLNEFNELLETNYPDPNKKLRKNLHYSIKALNTSVPIEDITEEIKESIKLLKNEQCAENSYKVLFYGPSGTGKTSYAEEVAKMTNTQLKIVTASDFLDSYVGETEKNIKNIFKEAAETHSILLVDEADSMIHSRGDTINRHNDMKVNEFITQMEKFPGILFCNTNLPENLDNATDRRFVRKVNFDYLTKEGIGILSEAYFGEYHLSENQVNQIYNSGDVAPGDFNVVNQRIHFMKKEKITADFITEELCSIVAGKKRSYERKIGFSN